MLLLLLLEFQKDLLDASEGRFYEAAMKIPDLMLRFLQGLCNAEFIEVPLNTVSLMDAEPTNIELANPGRRLSI